MQSDLANAVVSDLNQGNNSSHLDKNQSVELLGGI